MVLELKLAPTRQLYLIEEYVWLDSVMLLLLLSLVQDSMLLHLMKRVLALELMTAYRSLGSQWVLRLVLAITLVLATKKVVKPLLALMMVMASLLEPPLLSVFAAMSSLAVVVLLSPRAAVS